MGKKHTSSYEVAYYDGDFTGAMKIPALLAVVIKVSEEQTELLGRDAAYVAQFGLGWVITNYEIEIHRLPKVGEKVAITTQAMSYNKYFCYRNFWVHDEEGNECVFVKSTFVLMDQKNRKISSVLPEIIAPFDSEKSLKFIAMKKLKRSQRELFTLSCAFFDIDGNQHVNNAIYFNWLLDVLGYDFLTTHQPKKFL